MNLELFIAKKIHFSKEGDREVTPPAVRIAMIGIALGLAVMILSVAIVIGFKKEVRNKVIGFGSHIQITNFDSNSSYESQPIAVSDTLLNALDAFPGIRHVEKFATKLGILMTIGIIWTITGRREKALILPLRLSHSWTRTVFSGLNWMMRAITMRQTYMR